MAKISKKNQQAIEQALLRMREDMDKQKQKTEAKRWAAIEAPASLAQLLSRLTKDDLSNIRCNMELEGLSALKKQQLLGALNHHIIDKALYTFDEIDIDRYNLFRDMVDHNGWTDRFDINEEQISALTGIGLVFPGSLNGKKVLVMPEELVTKFKKADDKSYQKLIQRNTEWIRLTQGLLYYYGTLDIAKLIELIELYTGKYISLSYKYIDVILSASFYYGEIKLEETGLSNWRVFDPEQVKQEHAMRPDVDYYPFGYEQLIRAGQPSFVDKNPAFRKLVAFIKNNYEINDEEADSLVEECVYAIKIGEPLSGMIEYLQEHIEIDSLETARELADNLVYLNNNTRQWFLKGYMPSEMSAKEKELMNPLPAKVYDFGAEYTKRASKAQDNNNKVGRNDPCPCGSGKKYKKCCGQDIQ